MRKGMVAYGLAWIVLGLLTALASWLVPSDDTQAKDHLVMIMVSVHLATVFLVLFASDKVYPALAQALLGVCALMLGVYVCIGLGLPPMALEPIALGMLGGLANSCSMRGLNLLTMFGQVLAIAATAALLPLRFGVPWSQTGLSFVLALTACFLFSGLIRLFPSAWRPNEA